ELCPGVIATCRRIASADSDADGLSRNFPELPDKLQVIVGNCNAHSRRHFVDVVSNFPEECRHVLDSLAQPRCTGMMPRRRSAAYRRRSDCAFIRSTADRMETLSSYPQFPHPARRVSVR